MPYPTGTLISIGIRTADTINALDSSESVKNSFRAFDDAVFEQLHLMLLIYSGQRTYAKQWELRQKYLDGGAKAASPGGSYHNFGRAVDVIPVFYDGKPNWKLPDSVWIKIERIANQFGLQTGRSFGDPGHIKNTQGVTLLQLRNAKPGWEAFAQAEKTLTKVSPVKQALAFLTPAEGNKWIKPVGWGLLGVGVIYGIFEYRKNR